MAARVRAKVRRRIGEGGGGGRLDRRRVRRQSLPAAARAKGEAQPSLQILLYPLLDFGDEALRNPASFETAWPLSLAGMAWSRDHYLSPQTDAADPRLSPGRATDLGALAPAVIATGGFDPLRGQAEAYAIGLKAAGCAVDYRLYDGLTHDFGAFTAVTPVADAACREIAALAAKALS
ncbi:MAG: alpha/beta hydrolase [Caulobacteraceae bacterium]|nr:alpha/beta hydrolase [Caulobacteraceae bacterium]